MTCCLNLTIPWKSHWIFSFDPLHLHLLIHLHLYDSGNAMKDLRQNLPLLLDLELNSYPYSSILYCVRSLECSCGCSNCWVDIDCRSGWFWSEECRTCCFWRQATLPVCSSWCHRWGLWLRSAGRPTGAAVSLCVWSTSSSRFATAGWQECRAKSYRMLPR